MPQPLSLHPVEPNSQPGAALASSTIAAGFPSPADDYLDPAIDLNKELVTNATATFYARVKGESMRDANIHDGDVLVVDRSRDPRDNAIALCILNGEFTVKRLEIRPGNRIRLLPENPDFAPIRITAEMDFEVWGIVTYVIHKLA